MSSLSLDDVKLKTPDEMSDDEKDFLKENVEDLTDADKKDYKDILEDKKEPEEEEEDEDKKDVEEEKEEEEAKHSFKSDEDLNKYYAERKEQEKLDRKVAKESAKIEKGEFFPKGYKPADWNEFSKDFLEVIRQDREKASADQRRAMAKINDRLDGETEELRALIPGIPAPNTKARREFDRSIAEVMIQDRKITTVAKAYKQLELDKGLKKEAKEKKKDLAKKIGGGTGTGESAKDVKYEKFAKRDLDDAANAALEQFEKME